MSKAAFRYPRHVPQGSPSLNWPIFLEYSKNILGNWGRSPQFPTIFLEYSRNIGQFRLGEPWGTCLGYLDSVFDFHKACCPRLLESRSVFEGLSRGSRSYFGSALAFGRPRKTSKMHILTNETPWKIKEKLQLPILD